MPLWWNVWWCGRAVVGGNGEQACWQRAWTKQMMSVILFFWACHRQAGDAVGVSVIAGGVAEEPEHPAEGDDGWLENQHDDITCQVAVISRTASVCSLTWGGLVYCLEPWTGGRG